MAVPRPWLPGLPTRVRLIEPIGDGGTATVWRARDTHHGRDVAVKVIGGDGAAARLEREARSLARLGDVDGVLRVHEVGLTPDGTGWIVAQYAAGGSLAERLHSRRLSEAEVTSIGASLAETLAGAHRRDVVHGDVSPANVLFDGSGEVLLADFGSADLGPLEVAGSTGFTPAFAAPERLRGAPARAAGDVYALAATLDSAADQLSPQVQSLLDRCRAAKPAQRPDAVAVAGALRGLSTAPRRRWWRR